MPSDNDSPILDTQRDYFGAHTFKVVPGKENAKLPLGQDIRKQPVISHRQYLHISLYVPTDINWTGRGGSVSASTYSA